MGRNILTVEALAATEVASSEREVARQINIAIDLVAAKLVNTRSVCRSSYIHPAVFEDFRAGILGDVLAIRTTSERLIQWMDEAEIQVFRWLGKRK